MAWRELEAVRAFYGERRARRSGERYLKHIDDGLFLLGELGASERARRAFCLHPLVQADAELARSYPRIAELSDDPRVIVLVLEYRNIANAYLSPRRVASPAEIALSPLDEVNDMLRADKLQNHHDFLRHHQGTHPRAAELDAYFRLWLARLGVSPERQRELHARLEARG